MTTLGNNFFSKQCRNTFSDFFLIKCLHLKTPVIKLYLLLTFPPDYKILQQVREKTQIKRLI